MLFRSISADIGVCGPDAVRFKVYIDLFLQEYDPDLTNIGASGGVNEFHGGQYSYLNLGLLGVRTH